MKRQKNRNQYRWKKYRRILQQVNARSEEMRRRTDAELQRMTQVFRERLESGVSPAAILPEAYAVLREAAHRVLDMKPYDVQILAAAALYDGKIVDMGTGEGKTLVATLPLYVNALTGKSGILVTVNNYLAVRDGSQMRPLFEFLGLTVGIAVREDPAEVVETDEKREIYAADIVYTTSAGLAFDYLTENLGTSRQDLFLREFHFVIIDEADAVLLDGAMMPLVISGTPKLQSNVYDMVDRFVKMLKPGVDYEEKDRTVYLTDQGIDRAERYFSLDNMFREEHFYLVRRLQLALQANVLYQVNKQYVIRNGELVLLDEGTGRMMEKTRLRGGMHQAIEAKEHLPVSEENRTVASITYQNFYRMFPKMAGMSGTAQAESEELKKIYGLDTVAIPPNRKMRRKDLPDRYFSSRERQVRAVIQDALRFHEAGRPVLMITDSIALSQQCSQALIAQRIPHNVLNALNIPREAAIIAEAGQRGAVTVATAVAGRGTDIRLGEGVEDLGGMAILGVGRMSSRKLELQARGRSGRQGDPGTSQFYISEEDEVMLAAGQGEPEKKGGVYRWLGRSGARWRVNNAQATSEWSARQSRRTMLEMGASIQVQRELIYTMRNRFLREEEIEPSYVREMIGLAIEDFLQEEGEALTHDRISRFALDFIRYDAEWMERPEGVSLEEQGRSYLTRLAMTRLEQQLDKLRTDEQKREFMRVMVLKSIDEEWIEELDYLQQLKILVSGRKYASQNEVHEYHREAREAFMKMLPAIRKSIMRNVLMGDILYDKEGDLHIIAP